MDLRAFDYLRKFHTTSWAIWSENQDCSVDFFRSEINKLHARTVFVGLNRSEAWPEHLENTHLSNFHTPGHVGDGRLKRHIQDANLSNLIGGLMTDASDEIKTDSGAVLVDAREAIALLINKIGSVDNSPSRKIVCLGDKVFRTMRAGLGISQKPINHKPTKTIMVTAKVYAETWSVFRVWHSGNYGRYLHKSEVELPRQLRYINDFSQRFVN